MLCVAVISLCNSTLGFGRCLNGDCYRLNDTCNGVADCVYDGFDEMACKYLVHVFYS